MSWRHCGPTVALIGSILLSGCLASRPRVKSTQTEPSASGAKPRITSSIHAEGVDQHMPISLASCQIDEAQLTTDDDNLIQQASLATPTSLESHSTTVTSEWTPASNQSSTVPINLPTALAMIGGQHPVVGFARWRVQEAYAQLDRAKVMWLPSIQAGFNYRRHDGNYQDVQGNIVDVNLNSFNYGLGAGAIGAGSPAQPGVVARFHLADAIFLPKTAEKTAWARQHAASAVLNQQLLDAGITYIDLLEAYQDHQIIDEAVQRTKVLVKLTSDFAETGQGLKADADRAKTELALLQTRQLSVRERQLVVSTRLARALGIPMTSSLQPQDPVLIPLQMNESTTTEANLISTGLTNRPELKESQALVLAACEAYKREMYAPFVPSVVLGFSTTNFGGGLGNKAQSFDGRYDLDAMMVWETRNLGLGERAARRERTAQVQQATYSKLRLMDQVAQEVAQANAQVTIRAQQLEIAQNAIGTASDSYQRNVDRIREAQGLPIEVLQSIQSLEASQRAYLNAVANYNRAQLQLQFSLGWPISEHATVASVD